MFQAEGVGIPRLRHEPGAYAYSGVGASVVLTSSDTKQTYTMLGLLSMYLLSRCHSHRHRFHSFRMTSDMKHRPVANLRRATSAGYAIAIDLIPSQLRVAV